jgi:iron complex outermembrane receptor protein
MKRFRFRATSTVAIMPCMLTAFGSPCHGQQASGKEPVALDDITISVTARKIKEPLKDIPANVSVLSAPTLSNTVADMPNSLARQTPNVTYSNIGDPTQSSYSIRGMGPLIRPLNSMDSTVGFNYDGAPTTLLGAGVQPLDVERVEVLRGPQGTLYGRGTLAGAINYISKEADGKSEAFFRGEIGSQGYRLGELTAGAALVPDTLFGRVAIRFSNFDGDIHNGIIGGNDGGQALSAFKGTLRYVAPDQATTVKVTGFYNNERTNIPQFILRDMIGFPVSGADIRQKANREIGFANVTITHDLDFARVTSVTAVQHVDAVNLTDITDSYLFAVHPFFPGLPPSFWANPNMDKARLDQSEAVVSQELRLSSLDDSEIKWVGGLSYFSSDYGYKQNAISSISPVANGYFKNALTSNTYGAFGEASVPVIDKLTFTLGLRVAHDDQWFDGSYRSNGIFTIAPFFNQRHKYDETYVTGRAALNYAWTDAFTTYASVARGHSSGGYSHFTNNAPFGQPEDAFEPATNWSYEAGVKYFDPEGKFDITAAGFFNDVKNGPTFNYDPKTATFAYMPYDYHSTGFELQGRLALTESVSVRGGVGYIHAELVGVPSDDAAKVRSGNSVPNVPDWNANFGLDVKHPIVVDSFAGRLIGSVEYQYVGKRAGDPVNNFDLKSYGLVNLTAGVENDRVRIYGFARNLFDVRYEAFGSYLSAQAVGLVVGQGRTAGVGLTIKFD